MGGFLMRRGESAERTLGGIRSPIEPFLETKRTRKANRGTEPVRFETPALGGIRSPSPIFLSCYYGEKMGKGYWSCNDRNSRPLRNDKNNSLNDCFFVRRLMRGRDSVVGVVVQQKQFIQCGILQSRCPYSDRVKWISENIRKSVFKILKIKNAGKLL